MCILSRGKQDGERLRGPPPPYSLSRHDCGSFSHFSGRITGTTLALTIPKPALPILEMPTKSSPPPPSLECKKEKRCKWNAGSGAKMVLSELRAFKEQWQGPKHSSSRADYTWKSSPLPDLHRLAIDVNRTSFFCFGQLGKTPYPTGHSQHGR